MRRMLILAVAVLGLAATPAQGPELRSVMREKLVRSQKILEAVVTCDWVQLESESRELERITSDPRWTSLKYPEYARYSLSFVQAISDLHRAAAQRDLEKTPEAYVKVTLSCIDCHRYLARARLAESLTR